MCIRDRRRVRGCCTLRCVPRWNKRVALSSGWATEMWSRETAERCSDGCLPRRCQAFASTIPAKSSAA
eukprot:14164477-Alexandrium_andersonii.AAC.1